METLEKALNKLKYVSDCANKFLDNIEYIEYQEYIIDINNDKFRFHPKKTNCLIMDDDYVLNIRCDHLIVIDGYIENTFNDAILIIGNHKEHLTATIIYDIRENEIITNIK